MLLTVFATGQISESVLVIELRGLAIDVLFLLLFLNINVFVLIGCSFLLFSGMSSFYVLDISLIR